MTTTLLSSPDYAGVLKILAELNPSVSMKYWQKDTTISIWRDEKSGEPWKVKIDERGL